MKKSLYLSLYFLSDLIKDVTADPLIGSQVGRLTALGCDSIGLGLRELLRFLSRLLVYITIGCIDFVSLGLGATDGAALRQSTATACYGV